MHAIIIRHVFAFVFSLLLGIYLVPIIIQAALKLGFVDVPDGRLKLQKKPVAYLGGLAVFLPFITTLGLCLPFDNQVGFLLLGTTLLLFIGLIDDLKVLTPRQKFFGQFVAVLSLLKGEFSLKTALFGSIPNIALSAFWILSVINAFNLVDVMDGLCATLALVGSVIFCTMAILAGNHVVSVLLLAFIGSLLAFLVYNKPNARIYLGDAGSLFIGGFMGAVPLLMSWDPTVFAAPDTYVWYNEYVRPLCEVFFIPALVVGIPLIEVIGLFIIRTRLGIPFYNGSPHHFSIYLQKRGWNKWYVLLFSANAAFLLGLLALMLAQGVVHFYVLVSSLAVFILTWIYIIFVRKITG